MEPSGKGWPLPGTPALNAAIIFGLATITLSISSWSGGRDVSPVLVAPEVGERDSAGRYQRVLVLCVRWFLVLRVNSHGDEDGEHCYDYHKDRKAGEAFHLGACHPASVLRWSAVTDFPTNSDIACSPSQRFFSTHSNCISNSCD